MISRSAFRVAVAGVVVCAVLVGAGGLVSAQTLPEPPINGDNAFWRQYRLEHRDTWTTYSTAVDMHLGIATPQGELGIGVTQTLERHLTLSGSLGIGWTGLHASIMPRVQYPWEWGAVGVGLGATASSYSIVDDQFICFYDDYRCDDLKREVDLMLWGNMELYFISQAPESGFRFGVYFGVTKGVKAFNDRITNLETGRERPSTGKNAELPVYPYLGISVGNAF